MFYSVGREKSWPKPLRKGMFLRTIGTKSFSRHEPFDESSMHCSPKGPYKTKTHLTSKKNHPPTPVLKKKCIAYLGLPFFHLPSCPKRHRRSTSSSSLTSQQLPSPQDALRKEQLIEAFKTFDKASKKTRIVEV